MDPTKYSTMLSKKLLELRELVEANTVDYAAHLQGTYHNSETITLTAGQQVLVDNPTHGKLDAHWTDLGSGGNQREGQDGNKRTSCPHQPHSPTLTKGHLGGGTL